MIYRKMCLSVNPGMAFLALARTTSACASRIFWGGGVRGVTRGLKVRQRCCAIKNKFLTLRGCMCVIPTTVYLCAMPTSSCINSKKGFQPEGSDERWPASSQKNEANK